MPDTVSIIRLKGEPLSVEAEHRRHSDWVKQEAQLLMDELFLDLHQPVDTDLDLDRPTPMDMDWVEALELDSSPQVSNHSLKLSNSWQSLGLEEAQRDHFGPWVSPLKSTPFYQRLFLVLGGLAIVTPLSLWGGTILRASQPKSGIAATSVQSLDAPSDTAPNDTAPSHSDKEFASYAEKAIHQIEVSHRSVSQPVPPLLSFPSLSSVPPVAIASNQQSVVSEQSQPNTAPSQTRTGSTPASAADINRLALRVFQPAPVTSAVPSLSESPSASQVNVPPSLSAITPAPASTLPSLSPSISSPTTTIAAATPMNSPANASKKVIGIVELGLQSTLMVSNNGSHLNFQVGDTVNDAGWKLVQIAQGKAILQKGTEYKSLSEGQYF
jgi:hypothetical protein